jgi:cytidylate kinase
VHKKVNEMNKIVIAIDGHSSCGKSTLAKDLAKELSYTYIDTGAMYRAVTYYFMRKGLIKNKKLKSDKLKEYLSEISIHFQTQNNKLITFLNNENVEDVIREMEVSKNVSEVSSFAIVRKQMVKLQQEMGKEKAIILDGRDIGTVVFPNAEVKFFITASAKIRAQRRFLELQKKGSKASLNEILKNIIERDFQDENRKESPLRKAEDAILIDNSFLTREEQLQKALKIIKDKTNENRNR